MVEAAARLSHVIVLRPARARAAPLGPYRGPAAQRSDQFARRTISAEGIAVDADGNVYVAEGPASLADAGSAFTKYEVAR